VHQNKGDYDTALSYYERAFVIDKEIGDKVGIKNSLNNIGLVHSNKGDHDTAMEYYERAFVNRQGDW